MNHLKEQGFISWLSEILKVNEPDQLDLEIKRLGKDRLDELANQFNKEIWPIMAQQLENTSVKSAKAGSKLDYIIRLNGGCPEGYEVERFMAGGKPCSRCKKKSTVQMKKGSLMDSIKSEIESSKCGGKMKKKKMQEGGKYNEGEHANLVEKYKKGQIKQNSPEHRRLQELNRNSGHHEDGWSPKKKVKAPNKEQSKKATENIKKHLQWGIIFAQEGTKTTVKKKSSPRPVAHVGTSDPIALWGRTESQVSPRELPEVTVTAPKIKKPKLDQSTLYGWMMLNGFDSKDASFEGRKQLFQKIFGDVEYKGTASQNTKLLTALKAAGKKATDTDFVAGMNNLVMLKPSGIPKLK